MCVCVVIVVVVIVIVVDGIEEPIMIFGIFNCCLQQYVFNVIEFFGMVSVLIFESIPMVW